MTDRTIYADYEIVQYDYDGIEIGRDTVENTGTITLAEIEQNAVENNLDEVVIIPKRMEVRNGGTTEVEVTAEDWNDE